MKFDPTPLGHPVYMAKSSWPTGDSINKVPLYFDVSSLFILGA